MSPARCSSIRLFFAFLFSPRQPFVQERPEILADFRKPSILYAPSRAEFTQKAPNSGKVMKQLDLRSAVQAQPAQAPHVRQFVSAARALRLRRTRSANLQASQMETPQTPVRSSRPSSFRPWAAASPAWTGANPFRLLRSRPAPAAAPKPPRPPGSPTRSARPYEAAAAA